MSIINETQEQRDAELHQLTGVDIDTIQSIVICNPDTVRIYSGEEEPTTKDDIEDLYVNYDHLDFTGYLRTLMWTSATRRHQELFQVLGRCKNLRCLDYGSGVGTHAIALLENNNEVSILDVPGKLLDFSVKRIAARNMHCKNVIAHTDPLPLDYFDTIICSDVLEHVYNPLTLIKEITNSLKKEGLLHILVSEMVKLSHGHFKHAIDIWQNEGKKYLRQHYRQVGQTLWVKS